MADLRGAYPIGTRLVLNLSGQFHEVPYQLPQPQGRDTVYTVSGYDQGMGYLKVRVESYGPESREYGGFYPQRFKAASTVASVTNAALAPQTYDPSRTATAMNAAQARTARDMLVDGGVPREAMRIRSRSWDKDALYFALDVTEGGSTTKVYTLAKAKEFLDARVPTDVEPYLSSMRAGSVPVYQFRVHTANGNYTFLKSPDGSHWFSPGDIERCKGIVTHEGKRYRLGRKEFVPFVK